jgi:hypothetical protein
MPGDRDSWWLDEITFAGREKLGTGHVARYDAKMDVDLVYSRLAPHHLPDFWKAIALQGSPTSCGPGGAPSGGRDLQLCSARC